MALTPTHWWYATHIIQQCYIIGFNSAPLRHQRRFLKFTNDPEPNAGFVFVAALSGIFLSVP
jgi:hypothetical protein